MFFIVLVGVFLFAGGIIIAQSQSSSSANESLIADLNKQIDEQRAKIDKMAEDVEKYKDNIKSARNQQASLQNQIYILNNQIAKANLDIKAKEEEIKTTELEIKKVELEIKENELTITKNKNQLAAFIRQLDIYDKKSYLAVLLSNNSFSEFFDQIKNLENINENLKKTLNRVQELVEKLNNQKNELDKKNSQLSELLNKLENEKDILDEQKDTKQQLISETKNSERKFQGLVENLKKEQMAVNSLITNLERRLRDELEKRGAKEKFNLFGDAVLAWPTNIRRITVYFRDPDYPYRNLFEHSGLDLGMPSGTPVASAEAGYVAKVALGTRWYGNYILIIHNNNLATLYAHLSSANVKSDQYVSQGQIIGLSGNTGFSSGPHLHFEVRYNGIPVNPLSYLP
ncbi:MAG: peptidoglycan DD-metalloendopeptidase family protein [Patescibacteria group bacterium]